jgi:hypothetical protein
MKLTLRFWRFGVAVSAVGVIFSLGLPSLRDHFFEPDTLYRPAYEPPGWLSALLMVGCLVVVLRNRPSAKVPGYPSLFSFLVSFALTAGLSVAVVLEDSAYSFAWGFPFLVGFHALGIGSIVMAIRMRPKSAKDSPMGTSPSS